MREKFKQFVKLTGMADDMIKVAESANQRMLEQTNSNRTPEQQLKVLELNEKYMLLVRGRLDEFVERFADIYMDYYSEQDVDKLIAFYTSPDEQNKIAATDVLNEHRGDSAAIVKRSFEIIGAFHKELLKQLDGATLNRQMN